ncbi:MAG: hypothetical protein ABI769_01850 [Pseudomonadota bacterium]
MKLEIRVKTKLVATVCAVAVGWALPAFAQGPGWTATSTVAELIVTSAGGVNVRLVPELTGCVSQSGYGAAYASIYPNHVGINRMKADLLVAFTTGAHVALYLGDNECQVSELRLIH